MEKLAEEMTR